MEKECKFCSGHHIMSEHVAEGIHPMGLRIVMLRSMLGFPDEDDDEDEDPKGCCDGIELKHGNQIVFDNSSGEYAEQSIDINYCPFCGKKLSSEGSN
jgi:hypothetical protein